MVTKVTLEQVTEGLKSLIEEVKTELEIDSEVTEETKPLIIIKSEVLVTLIGRLEDLLDIQIPENCYPFFDKEKHEQLTIKQAAEILLKRATND